MGKGSPRMYLVDKWGQRVIKCISNANKCNVIGKYVKYYQTSHMWHYGRVMGLSEGL